MMNLNILASLKELRTKPVGQTAFSQDIGKFDIEYGIEPQPVEYDDDEEISEEVFEARNEDQTLKLQKMSKNPVNACDEIARFITEDNNSTYAALSPQDKNKAQILMSILSQGNLDSMNSMIATGLSPKRNAPLIEFSKAQEQSTPPAFKLVKGQDGNILITVTYKQNVNEIRCGKETISCDAKKSTQETMFTYELTDEMCDAFNEMQLDNFDNSEYLTLNPNGQNQAKADLINAKLQENNLSVPGFFANLDYAVNLTEQKQG